MKAFSFPLSRRLLLPARKERGIALIFVLAMLVLVLVVVMAVFSRAALHRQTGFASVSTLKTRLFSETATGFLLEDLRQEIEAGSQSDPSSSDVRIYRPITVAVAGTSIPGAPSMVPQRVSAGQIANVLKISRSGNRFFNQGDGYASDGPVRASDVGTDQRALNGRYLAKDRWNLARLMTTDEFAAFTVPDWIYVDRNGKTLTTFTAASLSQASKTDPANGDFVTGRYAYVLYDVGGLIDINVAGNQLDLAENGRRGRLHQISLEKIGDVSLPNFADFVTWRSPTTGGNASTTSGGNGLFDPKRTFLKVPSGEQAFVSRQDLLAYAAQPGSPIPEQALPFLTTFSRDVNAPLYEPNPNRSKTPASPSADEMNPAIATIRFDQDTPIQRPGEAAFTVKAGTPVMFRRFPLSKLRLFEEDAPNADEMAYYFGLEKVGSVWRYTKTVGGRIAKLSELATGADRREPNFFEILQAGIYTGSLGRNTDDGYTYEKERDKLQNFQILQIGANIIDQWDANDYPTTLEYPTGVAGEFEQFFGIENLPYISQIGVVGWRPTDKPERFQSWAIFDAWNPHQNADTPPQGIGGFRIVPVDGFGWANLSYLISGYHEGPLYKNTVANGGCVVQSPTLTLNEINQGRDFTFSATGDYSEPSTLGGIPSLHSSTPGLLLVDTELPPAIPAQGTRLKQLQLNINALMDLVDPYTFEPAAAPGEDEKGRRVYPPGTTFSGLQSEYWLVEENEAGEKLVSGRMGTKAHNTARLRGNWSFDLQAFHLSDNQWHTYQKVEGFASSQLDIANCPVTHDILKPVPADSYHLRNTHHSESDALKADEFYSWRSRGASVGMIKADPRTRRFGFSGWSQSNSFTAGNDFFGRSVRSSMNGITPNMQTDDRGTYLNGSYDWCFPGGVFSVGRKVGDSKAVAEGFEVLTKFTSPTQKNRVQVGLYALTRNNPQALDETNPARYSDPDGVIRPGDAYYGTFPTVPNRLAERPIILNRPFRSVGELGYVFRDVPWKTLDFFSRYSADLALLDLFTLDEGEGRMPIVAGKVNLNSRNTTALATLLHNASKQLGGINTAVPGAVLSEAEAKTLAEAIVSQSTISPFLNKGDLVPRVLDHATNANPLPGEAIKVARESVVRALEELGTNRTWNLMIDLVAQSGRFTAGSKTGADFLVQGEERVWIHVAIDRLTGEIVEMRKEVVDE